MSIEAMKQALEALKRIEHPDQSDVIEVLRQAIEQAERFDKQPTKILSTEEVLNSAGFYKAEKQEPVAWLCERDGQSYSFAYTAEQLHQLGYGNISVPPFRKVAPLYTTPPQQEPVKMVAYNCLCGRTMKFESVNGIVAPQREWVGLTQQDIDIAFDDTQEGGGFNEFARVIEQVLRGKNT